MKHVVLSILLAAATPAMAATGSVCIDASSHTQYNARPLSQHAVLARNAMGPDKSVAKVSTTCIHIYRDSIVALRSLTRCLDMGDEVVVSTIDGHGERCKVTAVTPVQLSYRDAKYSYN